MSREAPIDFSIFGKFEKEARTCFDALTEVGPKTVEWHQSLERATCFHKGDGSPVTVFDYVTQAMIMSHLLAEFPGDPIIAEETMKGDVLPEFLELVNRYAPRDMDVQSVLSHVKSYVPATVSRYWTIDPIDGTSGFKRRNGQWVVAIALIENSDCVFSAVAWPDPLPMYTGKSDSEPLYCFAARGIGSFITNGRTQFERVTIPESIASRQILPCRGDERKRRAMTQLLKSLGIKRNELFFTSMAKAFSVVLGIGDMYIRFPRNGEPVWDIAPFSTFVEEAGGCVTLSTGKRLTFTNQGETANSTSGIIITARGKEWHERVVSEYNKAFHGLFYAD